MAYTPTPREQFYIQLVAGIFFAIAGYTWYAGAPAWTTAFSGICGLIAQVLHELPSVAAQIPQSINTNPISPLVPGPFTQPSNPQYPVAPNPTKTVPFSLYPNPPPKK